MDGDGDMDALLGSHYGTLQYFENTGTAASPIFVERTGVANPLDGVDVGSFVVPAVADIDNDGDFDIFLAKYSPRGAHLWSSRFRDIRSDIGQGVAIREIDSSIILAGDFEGAVDFGGGVLTASPVLWDIVLARYSAGGAHLSSQHFGSPGTQTARDVAVGRTQTLLTGCLGNWIDFGDGTWTSAGSSDIFFASLEVE